jgi:hypothetical protein
LAPFSFAPMSSNTTSTFITLHLELDGYFLFFLKNNKLNQNFELSSNFFKLTFQRMPHLSTNDPFGMIFEHLWNCFHLEDSMGGFPQLFQFCSHIAKGHIPLFGP